MVTIADVLKSCRPAASPRDPCTVSTLTATFAAEVLLAETLNVTRAHLHAFPERELTLEQEQRFLNMFAQYRQGIPVAYITGHQEFWSLDLIVTPNALIPRPETELLVELILQNLHQPNLRIADLGTGSGAIALALATEKPDWEIYATDNSAAALEVAQTNAKRLQIKNIIFSKGVWTAALPSLKFTAIISNPPYIAADDPHWQYAHEPLSALVAEEDGLRDIRCIITEARNYLQPGGYLLLEHGFQQGKKVRDLFAAAGYHPIATHNDLAGLERVTVGVF